jgi:hypothetical protein
VIRQPAIALLLACIALPASAFDDCNPAVTALAVLYDVRSVMLTSYSSDYEVRGRVDKRLDDLRVPLPDGGFRWVRYVRPQGDPPTVVKGHSVVAAHDAGDRDTYEASAPHSFSVRIVVPRKRSLFNGNNPVYVGKVSIRYEVNGRSRTISQTIDEWMEPDTSRTFDLDGIADHADVAIDAGAQASHSRESLVEVHFKQAVPQDDPDNPNFGAIRSLQRVRSNPEPQVIDSEIAGFEQSLYSGMSSVPLAGIVEMLRHAEPLLKSSKTEEQEKGEKLLRQALRLLP